MGKKKSIKPHPPPNHRKQEKETKDSLRISSFGNERDGSGLFPRLFQLDLFFMDLLHLQHPLRDELVLALLVRMAFVLSFPGQVKLRLPSLVEYQEKVSALVSVWYGGLVLHHLCLFCYHLLRWNLAFLFVREFFT